MFDLLQFFSPASKLTGVVSFKRLLRTCLAGECDIVDQMRPFTLLRHGTGTPLPYKP
jgi:hypothetical protein